MTALAARPLHALPAPTVRPTGRPGLAGAPSPKVAVVINADAGSVRRLGRDLLEPLVAEQLGTAMTEFIWTPRETLDEAFARAIASKPGVLAVLGGDGTGRSALTAAAGRLPVAPLPGGTLNRLASLVFGGRDLKSALASLPQGRPLELPAGRVGKRRFFVVSGFGPLMELDRAREDWRGSGRLTAAWPRITGLDRRAFEPNLLWSAGQEQHAASAVVVALGPVDAAFGLAPAQERIALEAAGAELSGWRDLGRIALAVGARRWRGGAKVKAETGQSIQIVSRSGDPIYALLDGERCLLPPEFTLSYEPHAALAWGPGPEVVETPEPEILHPLP